MLHSQSPFFGGLDKAKNLYFPSTTVAGCASVELNNYLASMPVHVYNCALFGMPIPYEIHLSFPGGCQAHGNSTGGFHLFRIL